MCVSVLYTVCVPLSTGACVRAGLVNFPQLIAPFFILLYFLTQGLAVGLTALDLTMKNKVASSSERSIYL